jgi:hypothetical protein
MGKVTADKGGKMTIQRFRHKFNARPTQVDGIRFASKKEANYYSELKLRQAAGLVLFFLRQVPFHLPGKVRYICDFAEFLADGQVRFVDVKGYKTDMYKLKVKQVLECYGVHIEEA